MRRVRFSVLVWLVGGGPPNTVHLVEPQAELLAIGLYHADTKTLVKGTNP